MSWLCARTTSSASSSSVRGSFALKLLTLLAGRPTSLRRERRAACDEEWTTEYGRSMTPIRLSREEHDDFDGFVSGFGPRRLIGERSSVFR